MKAHGVVVALLLAACRAEGSGTSPPLPGAGGGDADGDGVCESRPDGRTAVSVHTFLWGGFALLSDGTVWCWGDHPTTGCPVAGTGPDARRSLPHKIELPCARLLDASTGYGLIVSTADEVWAWGVATNGVPVTIEAPGVTWVDAGEHAVAWGGPQGAFWWGDVPWLSEPLLEPQPFPFAADRVALGAGHICFISDGALRCFGYNDEGQLGDGTTGGQEDVTLEPVLASLPARVVAAAASSHRTSALDENGEFWTWGVARPFPAADEEPSGPLPAIWESLPPLCGFHRGDTAGCAWTCAGEAYCWGYSPLGIFRLDPQGGWESPMRILDLEPAAEISVDSNSPLCVRKLDGTVWCRGGYATGTNEQSEDGAAVQLHFGEDP